MNCELLRNAMNTLFSTLRFCRQISQRCLNSTAILYSDQRPDDYPVDDKQIKHEEFDGNIPIEKLGVTSCRSSGPGGQHVNKTNTKVTIAFQLDAATWIPEYARQKIAIIHKNQINKDGIWSIRSEKTRSQEMNFQDCIEKLKFYIDSANQKPVEPSAEELAKIRRAKERASKKRLQDKRHKQMLKISKTSDW